MGIGAHDREIKLLVGDVKDGILQLPEMQRKYVWKTTQVRDFFDSLYHQYPTGELLVWETDDQEHTRDLSTLGIGTSYRRPQLVLDGQQRLTSLFAVMTGAQVDVRDRIKPIDIVFNVMTEKFEVATAATRPQSGWVSLTRLYSSDPVDLLEELGFTLGSPESKEALKRMNRLAGIRDYRYRITVLEGLTYDEVTDIFVRINSGGNRLSNADLSLAQISSRWRGVSKEIGEFQRKAKSLGWDLDDSILLRVISALATNQATLSQLFKSGRDKTLTEEKLREAWQRAKPAMLQAIHFIKQNCLIDRFDMLPTNYILVPLTVFFDRNHTVTPRQERDLQRWLHMALIWARYSTSSETNLDQDIKSLSDEQPIQRMIQNIEDKVGHGRAVSERELQDELSNSPYMVLVYVLVRRNAARDWFQGVGIGEGQDLEFHHIFPQSLLKKLYPNRDQGRLINQIANLALLSQRANAKISASLPAEYLPSLDPARLRAQYVPTDSALWALDRYEDFARARRELLASAINELLASLMDEPAPWLGSAAKQLEARVAAAEQDVRALIDQRLTMHYGPRAWKQCVTSDIQDQVRQRIEQRVRHNPFEEGRFNTLAEKLTQCNFTDYAKIIRSNWALFEDVFRDRNTFDRQMDAAKDARNAFAHQREMNEGEQQIAAGSLYWIEQCLRQARRQEANLEEEAGEAGEADEDATA